MFKLIPVFLTKACKDSEKAPVKIPIMAPIPVKAMANLIPPSSAFVNLTPKIMAKPVMTISMTTPDPN